MSSYLPNNLQYCSRGLLAKLFFCFFIFSGTKMCTPNTGYLKLFSKNYRQVHFFFSKQIQCTIFYYLRLVITLVYLMEKNTSKIVKIIKIVHYFFIFCVGNIPSQISKHNNLTMQNISHKFHFPNS